MVDLSIAMLNYQRVCPNWIRTPCSTAASGLQVLVMVPALSQLVFVYFFQCISSAVVAGPRGLTTERFVMVVGCWLLGLRFLEWPFVSHPILHMVKRNRVFDGFGFVSFLLCLVSRLKPSNGSLKSRHGWNGATGFSCWQYHILSPHWFC